MIRGVSYEPYRVLFKCVQHFRSHIVAIDFQTVFSAYLAERSHERIILK